MISIKLSFFGELRRLSVEENALTFDYLVAITRQLYKHHLDDDGKKISFAWVDEEGDTVVLSTEDELKEALRVMNSLKMDTFKFFVVCHNDEHRVKERERKQKQPSIKMISNAWSRPYPLLGCHFPSLLGFGRVPTEVRSQLVENFLSSLADIASAMNTTIEQSSGGQESAGEHDDAQVQTNSKSSEGCGSPNGKGDQKQIPNPTASQAEPPQTSTQAEGHAQAMTHQDTLPERPPVIIVKSFTIPIHGNDADGKEAACNGKPSDAKLDEDVKKATPDNHVRSVEAGSIYNVPSEDSSAAGEHPAPQQPNCNDTGSGISPSEIEAWSTELRLLSDMGLHDIAMLLPLLRVHCLHPAALQHSKVIDPRAMQHVVRSALSLIR